MIKSDATRRVRALLAKADSTEHPPEAEALRAKAIELRLRYGVSDADLAQAEDELEDIEIFGAKVFWYSRQVTPLLVEMRAMLATVKQRMAGETLGNRTETLVRFRNDVRDLMQKIEADRNALIKELYEELLAGYLKDSGYAADSPHAHDMTIQSTKFHTVDMRSDTIERIVGRSSKALWAKEMARIEAERATSAQPSESES